MLRELDARLVFALNTHMHADHVTGTGLLKKRLPPAQSAISERAGAMADVLLKHGQLLRVGCIEIECRFTPGHTDGCCTYVVHSFI